MNVVINGVEYVRRFRILPTSETGTFGQSLRTMRKSLKLSLDKAAIEIGCSKSYLWELEHDGAEPGLRIACRIADAYGVPLQALAACSITHDMGDKP